MIDNQNIKMNALFWKTAKNTRKITKIHSWTGKGENYLRKTEVKAVEKQIKPRSQFLAGSEKCTLGPNQHG